MRRAQDDRDAQRAEVVDARDRMAELDLKAGTAAVVADAEQRLVELRQRETEARSIYGGALPGPSFWERVPSGADVHLGDLWDSFFLVVPLVSTTFASFDRLMDGMNEASLGWLIVDEAGQASPQQAVGALWRSARALVIGDPLQIEPVSTVPTGLLRAICSSYGGAHPDLWAAPRASVQTVTDSVSPLMASLGGCQRP